MNWINRKIKKNKIVIYTAIFGNYDDLKNQDIDLEGCDFYCFTDDENLKSDKFKIILDKSNHKDSNRNAKIYKILPHKFFPQYEYSIWIDGSVEMKDFCPKEMIKNLLEKKDMAFFKHPDRNCVYEEAIACIALNKDNESVINRQMTKYRSELYPANNGLTANSVIIRRHNQPKVIKLAEDWWTEIENYSRRDQLSFNYVAWKNNIDYTVIDEIIWDNKYFRVLNHLI